MGRRRRPTYSPEFRAEAASVVVWVLGAVASTRGNAGRHRSGSAGTSSYRIGCAWCMRCTGVFMDGRGSIAPCGDAGIRISPNVSRG